MPVDLTLELTTRPGSTVVTVAGDLDLAGYRLLRDGLLKVAAEVPPRLIADVDALVIEDLSPATVFTFVAKRVENWPGIPFAVVTRQHRHLRAFHRHGIDRFVAVHATVEKAEAGAATPVRLTARRVLPRTPAVIDDARELVRDHAVRWKVPELVDDATLVVGELVRNVVQHTGSEPDLRLALWSGLFSVAVADESDHPATLLERADAREPGLGLRIVADVARAWGNSHRWSGGKIVWAVLTRRSPGVGGPG
ncbi:ATP-binding protein [Amycolatopsis sp., V23-08]|uniref:ATP-binding protein n=1 Tax=Amycolatopsis heterodermiae TaxID=3110235 RepID=A0ABU5R444_9PSEU|nr:STAS domain-containing protein [Amycolatopsis sp., V23-08]MEA5360998.1 ATP-binding protein [Amycolatopsis sp., V23-08]